MVALWFRMCVTSELIGWLLEWTDRKVVLRGQSEVLTAKCSVNGASGKPHIAPHLGALCIIKSCFSECSRQRQDDGMKEFSSLLMCEHQA